MVFEVAEMNLDFFEVLFSVMSDRFDEISFPMEDHHTKPRTAIVRLMDNFCERSMALQCNT